MLVCCEGVVLHCEEVVSGGVLYCTVVCSYTLEPS